MQALDYWKAVTADRADFLDRIVGLLAESGASATASSAARPSTPTCNRS